MAFHLLDTRALDKELAEDEVSEPDTLKYVLANAFVWYFMGHYNIYMGAFVDWMLAFDFVIVCLIAVLGFLKCYEINGGDDGRHYLLRITCLTLPIGIKVIGAGLIVSWGLYFAAPYVFDPMTFRNPEKVADLVFFLLPIVFEGIFYWRLLHHMRLIRRHEIRIADSV